MFENAHYGKAYLCRNNTVAYYCRYSEPDKRHCLMVNDSENDFIKCFDDGLVFHISDDTIKSIKSAKLKVDVEKLKGYKLDIVKEL